LATPLPLSTRFSLRRTVLNPTWLRLASGLVLFIFVLAHLINHALGLVSLDAMQAGQDLRRAVTRNPLGIAVLVSAALVHLGLGLARFITVDAARLGPRSLIQLIFGLLIPVLLIRHVVGTHGVTLMFGIKDSYAYALWAMWPGEAINQAMLITLVWVHGSIGLHYWLNQRDWYRRTLWLWQGLAVLIPALAYAGFVSAGRLAQVQGGYENPFQPGQYGQFVQVVRTSNQIYLVILALSVLAWGLLLIANRLGSRIRISYVNGPTVNAPRGLSLLAISRLHRVPHASVCGGRARCSTCRVRVLVGQDQLAPPAEQELQVLRRVGAPDNVRLACQVYPTGAVTVSTLLPATVDATRSETADKYLWGVEQEVTVMFCDLRGFTKLSEGRLPYDVVFLLNQFLGRMAETIEDSGGFVDKFMGDGIMAIFGMNTTPETGARQALAAARAMGGVLESLSQSLREALPAPLSMGIGLHSGTAILGRIGAVPHHRTGAAQLTALGETVNVASRLEGMTKELGVQLVVSAACLTRAGMQPGPDCVAHTVAVRGLSQPITVQTWRRPTDMPAAFEPGNQARSTTSPGSVSAARNT
jgi:adenylate cyclase